MSSEDDSFEFADDEESLAVGAVGAVVVATELAPEAGGNTEEEEQGGQEEGQGGQEEAGLLLEEEHKDLEHSADQFDPEEIKQDAPSMSRFEDVSRVDDKASSIDGMQGTIDELFSLPNALSKPHTPPKSRKRASKRKPTAEKPEDLRHIPILNRDTENKNTYDLDYLMDAQKAAMAKHRFATKDDPKPERTEDMSEVDFIRKNIEETQSQHIRTPQSSMSASLSLDYLALPQKLERKSMNQKQSTEFVDRLLSYRKQVQDKVKQTQQELQLRESANCTFAPTISGTKATGPRRKPEDLYYAGVTKAKETQRIQERLREEKTPEPSTFRPSLNQQSLKLLEKRKQDGTPVYEKLYSAHKEDVKKKIQGQTTPARSKSVGHDTDLTFKPSINKRSEGMTRGKKVDEALYEDAKRRNDKLKEVPKLQPFEPKLSKNSEKVLISKFEDEFSTSWTRFSPTDQLPTMTILRQFLEDLRFDPVKGDDQIFVGAVWDALDGNSRTNVARKHLLSLLKVILHFKPGPKQTTDQPAPDGRFCVIDGDELLICPKDIPRIHKAFEGVYEARLTAGKKTSAPSLQPQGYSFKPDMSKTAKTPRGRSRSGSVSSLSSEWRLMGDPARLEAKLKFAREQMEKAQMAECTFKPKLKQSKFAPVPPAYQTEDSAQTEKRPSDRNTALYQLAKLTKARKEVTNNTETRTRKDRNRVRKGKQRVHIHPKCRLL